MKEFIKDETIGCRYSMILRSAILMMVGDDDNDDDHHDHDDGMDAHYNGSVSEPFWSNMIRVHTVSFECGGG